MLYRVQVLLGLAFALAFPLLSAGLAQDAAPRQPALPAPAEPGTPSLVTVTERETLPESPESKAAADGSSATPARAATPSTEPPPDAARAENTAGSNSTNSKSPFDPAVVAAGAVAFQNRCLTCHDAQRSLSKQKSLPAWRGVVQRMANKSGADIALSDVEPIATYLASRAPGLTPSGTSSAGNRTGDEPEPESTAAQQLSVFGTLSPTWRGGDNNLQNSGFFPDAWVGVNWQSSNPLSARATACVTCHIESRQGNRIELVEAAVRLDLSTFLSSCNRDVKSSIDAGRFIVPFGAFASQSSPGAYRTVSRPLMYNMGQRVFASDLGDPVLPMPYSDEGANFNLSVPVYDTVHAAIDAYVVNGLQGGASGIDFFASRDYVDNNTNASVGGRLTMGNRFLKFGTSILSGQFAPPAGVGPLSQSMNYNVYGWDATLRWSDRLRVQFEYARRDSDRISFADLANIRRIREGVSGYCLEAEYQFCRGEQHQLSFLMRFDQQNRLSDLPPPGSSLAAGRFEVRRFTYGPNWTLPGGSLLMLNHEHWMLPAGLARKNVEVIGVRWAMTF